MALILRPAVLEDIPQLLPLIGKICDFHRSQDAARYSFLPQVEQRYPKWVKGLINDPRNLCLVVEDNAGEKPASAKLAAFLLAEVEQEIPIYELKEYGYIHDVWVEAEYRREGLAKQLMTAAIEHFRQLGITQLRLDTLVDNDRAIRLYQTCGFRASTTQMLLELHPASD
jgi:ribosomal protein S18 acetylase RimI-like enzyme